MKKKKRKLIKNNIKKYICINLKAAFLSHIERKENKLKQLDKLEYKMLKKQPYLISKYFFGGKVKLMSLLRLKCH